MGRRMTLKGQISLCLAAFFLALAGQIFLSFYQSGTVLRELDDQMGNFNAISRFQNGVQQSLNALESYRWEYGDAGELLDQLHEVTGTAIPRRLAALKGKARRFDLTCEKAGMDGVVLDFLK